MSLLSCSLTPEEEQLEILSKNIYIFGKPLTFFLFSNSLSRTHEHLLYITIVGAPAPIAPDRRSFIAANSSQIRLHLSAWYDGGCEIDKFTVQYRVRGQQEWTLVSNNIVREQSSLVIRDLAPATSYELLVGAQNQVGLTEVKYRFQTLDQDGKQVPASEANSFASSSAGSEDSEMIVDYSDADGTRREFWPVSSQNMNEPTATNSVTKSVLIMGRFLNSAPALVLSLCFFVVLLMVVIFYKFNNQTAGEAASSSSPTASTLNLNSNNKYHPTGGASSHSGGEQNTNDSELTCSGAGGAGGGNFSAGSACTDSPARMSTFLPSSQHSMRLLGNNSLANNSSNNNNYSPAPESCLYQPFCNPVTTTAPATHNQSLEYSHYGLPSATYEGVAAAANIYSGLMAAPQRSATMDQVNQPQALAVASEPDRSRQLIQLLMLQQQQGQSQTLDRIPENNSLHHQHHNQNTTGSYSATAAALATMARGANTRQQASLRLDY